MKKNLCLLPMVVAMASAVTMPAYSKQTVFSEGDRKVDIGGRAHFQYIQRNPDNGESTEDIGFRRLRIVIDAYIDKNWGGQIEWDFGEGSDLETNASINNAVLVDGYIEYKHSNGGKLRLGHTRVVQFSRSDLTSSNNSHQIERTFVGNTNSGVPGRQTGIGWLSTRKETTKFVWDVGVAFAEIDPANNQIDFDSAVNSDTGNSEGLLVGGRIQYFPLGYFKETHDNFDGQSKLGFALAVYQWDNDGDQRGLDADDPDIENITGIELSSAYRGYGWSLDAQYNSFSAEAVTADLAKISGPTIFSANGDVELDVYAIEVGYMLVPEKFQIALSFATQDAETYAETFTQTQIGATYFIKKHDVKFQASYRIEDNEDGVVGNDNNTFFLQAQYLY
ncbi:MAG: hypothetical protein JKY90_09355 [Gammaproteobacteria bacterium]|nr:hypothetical protein [Gammaproteobacteria bacterium]